MFKAMVLLKRKPGMTLKEFIDYYETRHAPLGVKYQTKMSRYIRRFLHPLPYPLDGKILEPAYDVLTELHFKDRQTYEEGMQLMLAPEANKVLSEDEKKFLDLPSSRLVFVEDRESKIPGVQGTPKENVKAIVLLKRRAGMTMDEFVNYYENNHAPLGVKYGTGMSRYQRHFLRPAPYPLDGSLHEAEYDVATEVSFANAEDAKRAQDAMAAPEANKIVSEDETKVFNLVTRRFVSVEDHESHLPWMH